MSKSITRLSLSRWEMKDTFKSSEKLEHFRKTLKRLWLNWLKCCGLFHRFMSHPHMHIQSGSECSLHCFSGTNQFYYSVESKSTKMGDKSCRWGRSASNMWADTVTQSYEVIFWTNSFFITLTIGLLWRSQLSHNIPGHSTTDGKIYMFFFIVCHQLAHMSVTTACKPF